MTDPGARKQNYFIFILFITTSIGLIYDSFESNEFTLYLIGSFHRTPVSLP